jgi:SHS2 domain-containing protein
LINLLITLVLLFLLSLAAAAAAAAARRGEKFDRSRHECGTEVKAITYSAMQIRQQPGDVEVFVIVDI